MKELKDFNLTGNVVHTAWFQTITKANGKADLVAINVLAEIVYWYKPVEVRDEITGAHLGWRNKYKGDLLQKSYASIANQFGITERQAKEAVISLEKLKVIERVFKNIVSNGVVLNNVLYIKLNIDKLKELSNVSSERIEKNKAIREQQKVKRKRKKQCKTASVTTRKSDRCHIKKTSLSHSNDTPITLECDTPITLECDPSPIIMAHPPHYNGIPPTLECETNTEITTEITTKITTESKRINKKHTRTQVQELVKKIFTDYATGDEELLNTLLAFQEMRANLKNGDLTERAAELMLKELNKLGVTREEKIAIINRSILNNWKGVFALPKDYELTSSKTVYEGQGYSVETGEGTIQPKSAFDKLREKYGE